MSAHLVHVVGARPNFVKAAPVLKALAAHRDVRQTLVHTGQHYDDRMSAIFFRELDLPRPDVDLGVGSGSHGVQTGALLAALEPVFVDLAPTAVIVYGDVNSTIAAALVCAKLGIGLVHVEAGLRSFDRTMPEEVNRVVTDQLSDLLLTTSAEAYAHLATEGVDAAKVRFVGNTMIDTLLANLDRFDVSSVRSLLGLEGAYAVTTVHRPANVDDPGAVRTLVEALSGVAARIPLVVPLHPRGRVRLEEAGLAVAPGVRIVDPLGYVDFLGLVRGASLVVTDSGGVQEETTVLDVPCLTVRPNTERPVTITHGTNQLVPLEQLVDRAEEVLDGRRVAPRDRPPLWDGHAGRRAAAEIIEFSRNR
ncbi:UDP-N-acetylglucosamine 2-epimerase (non-hydrolyzing) [Nitriliruptoraceae bacterium ZYF776]|nr:UDP-N-acetylglucosamine 2-epimerase (non-hydrolyzing) [Profundirhabdus halotolerans]